MAAFDDDELIQLSFLRDEETDALISDGFLNADLRLSSPLDEVVTFHLRELVLCVTTGPHYPVHPASFEVTNISLPREEVDRLRHSLRTIITMAGSTNNLERWRAPSERNAYGVFEPVMVVLALAQETDRHLQQFRERPSRTSISKDPSTTHDPTCLHVDSKRGVEVNSIQYSTKELAFRLLQASPAMIAAEVPEDFRVLHIEQVLRADLARKLQDLQVDLRKTLLVLGIEKLRQYVPAALRNSRLEDMVEHLVQPKLTFHGTQRHHVPSIVRHGFSLPGSKNSETGETHQVRCGSTYGRGIYTSPSAEFSLAYTGNFCERTPPGQFFGVKLFVCATVMGRSRAVDRGDVWYNKTVPMEGADSHIGNRGCEYVVFNNAQTIPVYVIHIDWGEKNYQYFSAVPDDPRMWRAALSTSKRLNMRRLGQQTMLPGDKKRAREAVFAKAAKYFPYGYGPATGNRFVVEEVGEVSEDEEDYGDYQALRAAEAVETWANHSTLNFWTWVKSEAQEEEVLAEGLHTADEYNWQRNAQAVPKQFKKPASAWDTLAFKADDEDLDLGITKLQDDQA